MNTLFSASVPNGAGIAKSRSLKDARYQAILSEILEREANLRGKTLSIVPHVSVPHVPSFFSRVLSIFGF